MERRYRLMSKLGVRNLSGYNAKIADADKREQKIPNPFSLTPDAPEPLGKLPQVVVVIDELDHDFQFEVDRKNAMLGELGRMTAGSPIVLMLLARERGLHTCAQEIWSLVPGTVGQFLEAPANLMLFSGMALGFADPSQPINTLRTERAALAEFATLHGFDAMTPVDEVLHTLDDLVRAAKIRYIGASNFSGWHLMKSLACSDRFGLARYVAHQAYYSLVGREYEWELMPLALDQRVGCVVWSPLGWARLTGKIRRGQPRPDVSRLHRQGTADAGPPIPDEYLYTVVDALDAVAAETGKTVPQIAINWLLQRPSVSTVIIGARNEAQLRQNLGAVGWALSPAQVARLDAASAVTPIYPYWHQLQFAERNPFPLRLA